MFLLAHSLQLTSPTSQRPLSASGHAAGAADRVVEDILARGGTAGSFAADITDEAAVASLVSQAADRLGRIDVLVVNATGPQPVVPVEELSWQDRPPGPAAVLRQEPDAARAGGPAWDEGAWTRPDRPDRLGHLRACVAGHVSLPSS
jgi:NAD(P)-dependent dehydrogenase (short-subunit alcohol dehydrogenase family)